jgi:hypothetical protein
MAIIRITVLELFFWGNGSRPVRWSALGIHERSRDPGKFRCDFRKGIHDSGSKCWPLPSRMIWIAFIGRTPSIANQLELARGG